MEKNLSQKNYSIIAGCILLLYSLYNIGQKIYGIFKGFGVFNFSYFVYIIPIIILCIMLLSKKNNVVIPISLVILSLGNLFWLIKEVVSYLFKYFIIVNLFFAVAYFFTFISSIFLAIISWSSYKKSSNNVAKLWFMPAVFEFLYMITLMIMLSRYGTFADNIGFLIEHTIYCVGIAFAGLALSSTAMKSEESISKVSNNTQTTNDGYCDMTKHILLLFFIGWIWQYIWIYRTTDYLNKTPNEEKRDPATKLLLCMFVPFYYIYWIYQSARRIEILAKEKNIDSDIVTLSVVLSLFVGIVPPIIMQSKLNQICKSENKVATVKNVEQKAEINSDKTDEIRNYKKLLDDGIITEEEFEAKKKQLLGL